jgi:hypothetical protein
VLVTPLDSKKQDVYLFKNSVPSFLEYVHNPVVIVRSVNELNAQVLYVYLGCNMRWTARSGHIDIFLMQTLYYSYILC